MTCPLCSAALASAVAYRDHLADEHDLQDDEGTATVIQVEPPSEEEVVDPDLAFMAEAMLDAPSHVPASSPSEPLPAPKNGTVVENDGVKKPVRVPVRPPSGRYPLAIQYGDVALYAPGLVLVLIAAVRLDADVLGFVFLLLGVALIVLGMLLPLVHGRR